MTPRGPLLAAALTSVALCGCALHRNQHIAPQPEVEMDEEVLDEFEHEVREYVELHQELLRRIPSVGPDATPEEIAAHRDKMKRGIQQERRHSRKGEIFEPKVEAAFRRIVTKAVSGPEGAALAKGAAEGNPRREGTPDPADPSREHATPVRVAVNATYNDDAPLSSVPPDLLLELPQLPEQVKYGFVGRDLILRDTEANVILDYIEDMLPTLPR